MLGDSSMVSGHKRAEFASFEAIPDAVIAVDRDGLIVFANRHACRVFGYARGEMVGLTFESLIPERYRERHARLVRGFLAKPSARPMGINRELLGLRRDGEEFPAEIAIGPTENGTLTVAVIRDISAFVKMRVKLSESDARSLELARSFRNTPIGLCHFDKELRYVRINQWLAAINGLPVEEHLGRTISDVLPDVALGVESQLRQVLQTGEPIVNGLVEATTPAHPKTPRTYMHNYYPDRSANGALVGIFCVVQDVTDARQELEGAQAEIKKLRDQLRAENIYLQAEIKSSHDFDDIIGNSAAIMATTYKVEQVAETDATVLLFGETGTGKELMARAIHSRSKRNMRLLIKIDCTTLPHGLIESELFGHEKGAFTGAHESKPGRFELADGGTIFLDEIGELPTDLQAKLLQVIQEGEFQRLGGRRMRRVDVRIIAATNRDLPTEMREGRFRSDLYYRLNVFPIEIPPLRHRREDIPLLVSYFVSRRGRALGKHITSIPKATMDGLMAYDWPGNIRELQNACERAIIQSPGRKLVLPDGLPHAITPGRTGQGTAMKDLKGIERKHIFEVLEESGWKIKGEGNAANRLGLNSSTLRSRMKKLGIERPI
jgi:chemotaxis protein methyltransferase CheR